VYLKSAVLRSRRFGSFEVFAPSQALQQVDGPTVDASKAAFEMAGVGPGDIDVAQLQDTESGAEVMHMAENGFCEHGEQEQLIQSGATHIGGSMPINTDGGCLANGEPIGASGLRQVYENVLQLRNEKTRLTPEQIAARDPSYSFQDLLDRESVEVPDALRDSTETYLGSEDIDIARYTSREFFQQEVENVWRKTWQVACRENRLRNPGDFFVYDIVDDSILLTRTESGEIKGFYNSCLHRGRALKRGAGRADNFRCPYHGWVWSLQGDFEGAPCQWDFPHVTEEAFKLPEVKVATWGGWVFINMDEDAPELAQYMDILPAHMDQWKHEQRFVAAHVEKVIGANWKAALEAFIESYHAIATHPQLMNSQYDVWGDHVSRTITAFGVANPSHAERFTEQQSMDAMMELMGVEEMPQLAPGETAREKLAEITLPLPAVSQLRPLGRPRHGHHLSTPSQWRRR
jgi:nitrite reductase/ring-hydroxylating ferredoxin subunit